MKRRTFLGVIGGVSLGMVIGCDDKRSSAPTSQGASSKPTAGADGGDKAFVIGVSQSNLGEPYRVQMNADIKTEADKNPQLRLVFKDAQNDTLKQRAQVEEFVAQGVNLLIISPKEAQPLSEPVAKAIEAGIPVVVLDRRLIGDRFTAFIGGDNRKIGRAAGEWVKRTLGGRGKIVELKGLMTTVPAQERHAGFVEGLAGSDIQTVFDVDMKWLEPEARREMESALARENDIALVFAHNDPGAHGAYLAAQAVGREKSMKFVGIDALPQEGVAYVHQGVLDATFQYPTGGAQAIQTALKILKGESVQKETILGSRIFTRDNVASGGEALP